LTVKRAYKKRKKWPVLAALLIIAAAAGIAAAWNFLKVQSSPQETAEQYFALLNKQEYGKMYDLLSEKAKENITKEEFIGRNQNIYEGIAAQNIKIGLKGEPEYKEGKKQAEVTYSTQMETSAGDVDFGNKMQMIKEEKNFRVKWDSTLIFPSLKDEYKVQINTQTAKRGSILDRNKQMLAGEGTVLEVGLVPGKMDVNGDESIKKIAELLKLTEQEIHQSLDASYVQDDSFVPIKEISKADTEIEEKLLEIPGIMVNEKQERVYPLGEAAGQLTGYIQPVTAEELEDLREKGYDENSLIGKAGLERAFEDELRASVGKSIDIVDESGVRIETVALKPAKDGKDVQVTIDSSMQMKAYELFSADPGNVSAMNPKSGEVLALVSSPGYDPNEFVMGISGQRWEELNNDSNQPLTNRFNTSWVPGSVFKSVTAAIGVDSGLIKPDENIGYEGLKWQKDGSWGDYYITTLTDYGPEVNLNNALVYSDNIYFAKAALNIGADIMAENLEKMGFNEEIPFELSLSVSTYDEDNNIDSDIQLADTGYGQGQLLVNPLHLISMYTMFVNEGNMIQPTLLYKENPEGKIWKQQVITPQAADLIKGDLIQVIENPAGTGAKAKIEGITMLGKTGTAEIKESQDDTSGVERGWFVCETTEDISNPVVIAGMVEDVKSKGGSTYVTEKVREIVADYEQ
jgi:cell division protein FtsI/penicillin-binding protein 2